MMKCCDLVWSSVGCVQRHQPPPIIYPTSSSTVLLSQSYPQFSSVPQLSSTTKQLSLNMSDYGTNNISELSSELKHQWKM